jgi:hypothetical protein
MPRCIELSGTALRAYLRDLVLAERGVEAELAERVAERGAAGIRRMLVVRGPHRGIRRYSRRTIRPVRRAADAPREAPAAGPQAQPAFDPYSFAVEALLIRQGEAALAQRLDEIGEPADLLALAKAQRIALDPALGAGANAVALRAAILRGACKRLADRRAAAG